MKCVKEMWFIIIFVITLCFPIYGIFFEKNIELSGVTSAPEVVELSENSVGNGAYQTYLNDLWESSFPGKGALIKLRNQLMYSVGSVSPNANVIVGKEGYLYELPYIKYQLQISVPKTEDYFLTLESNLKELNKLLKENEKELYVFITPSKAYFLEEYIPDRYKLLSNKGMYEYTNYEKIIQTLDASDIPYFDSVKYLEENKETGKYNAPLFYKSGIHWSHVWGRVQHPNFFPIWIV